MKLHVISVMAFLLASPAAMAVPYVGVDIGANSLESTNAAPPYLPQDTIGFDLHAGERFGMFAAELGYESNQRGGNINLYNLHIDQLTLDGIFYFPIVGNVSLLATGGISEANYGASTFARIGNASADAALFHGDEFAWRAGTGLSFLLGGVELHAIGRYEPLKMNGIAKSALSISAGINFYL